MIELENGKDQFVYLAGAVSGLTPEQFHSKFDTCRKWLEKQIPDNLQIVVPTDICDDNWDWFTCMEVCMEALKNCTAVYFMPDWTTSKGATCEKYVAEALGLELTFLGYNTNGDWCFTK